MLGTYYLKAKKYQEALKYLEKSFAIERTSLAAEGIAVAAMALYKYDMARDAAESAIRIDPYACGILPGIIENIFKG